MAADEAGEKSEQPTPRRREEARQKGQVPRSADLSAALVILAALLLLNMNGPDIFDGLRDLMQRMLSVEDVQAGAAVEWIRVAGLAAAGMLAPFMLLLVALTIAGNLAQTGLVLATEKLQPDLSHLNPLKGLKRLFSLDSLSRTLFSILKLALVAAVAWYTLAGEIERLLGVSNSEPGGVLQMSAAIAYTLCLRMALVLLILGLADYLVQRWKLERNLRMTKQEVRDELKRMEGDPLLKARRRRVAMSLMQQRLAADVPKADVIVTNPTEYAVAIRYDESSMAAPRVVAKGADLLALRIRQIAQQHGVPIVQRPPLARGLYAAVEVGGQIPPMFYKAVAEVLAYVYRLSGKAAG